MQNVERETNAYPGWIKNNINIINSINNSSIIIIIIIQKVSHVSFCLLLLFLHARAWWVISYCLSESLVILALWFSNKKNFFLAKVISMNNFRNKLRHKTHLLLQNLNSDKKQFY